MQLPDLHVGRPAHRDGLSVFPVWNGAAVPRSDYTVRSPLLKVQEREEDPQVHQLIATNRGMHPTLLIAGELLSGGMQDRVVHRSTMVPPGAREPVTVRCVERSRWSGGSRHVRGGEHLRPSLRAAGCQRELWAQMDEVAAADSASPSVGGSPRHTEDHTSPPTPLTPLPFQTGVLFGVAGRPVLLEVFDAPHVFAAMWDQLLTAATADAQHQPSQQTSGMPARQFVDHIGALPLRHVTAAVAATAAGRTGGPRAEALTWAGRIVHLVAVNTPRPSASGSR